MPPQRLRVPEIHGHAWVRNEIDRYLLKSMEERRIAPSPEADRETLIRRLSFDLTGLPPTAEEVDAFLADTRADAYERLVDRLLASPHYGERMALFWLDLVRYADTTGYHSDNHVDLYPYRDYVIDAFNRNKPFDRFTVEQLAGDLLADAERGADDRLGLQPAAPDDAGGGRAGQGVPGQVLGRPGPQRVDGLAGGDHGLRRVPRPQVRPVHHEGFLSLRGVLRRPQGNRRRRPAADPVPQPGPGRGPARHRRPSRAPGRGPEQADARARGRSEGMGELARSRCLRGHAQGRPQGHARHRQGRAREADGGAEEARGRPLPDDRARLEPVRKQINELQTKRQEVEARVPTCLVSTSVPPRVMRILPRGNWLDETGPVVTPDVPASLPALGVKDRQATRLDLAGG